MAETKTDNKPKANTTTKETPKTEKPKTETKIENIKKEAEEVFEKDVNVVDVSKSEEVKQDVVPEQTEADYAGYKIPVEPSRYNVTVIYTEHRIAENLLSTNVFYGPYTITFSIEQNGQTVEYEYPYSSIKKIIKKKV